MRRSSAAATTRAAHPDLATSAHAPSFDAPRPDRTFRLLRLSIDKRVIDVTTPTTYWLRLQVADTHHLRWYVAPGAPSEGWGAEVPFTRAQLGRGSATATVTTTPPAPAVGA